MNEVREIAFAKVNLWLEILGKREDGFHELETVMHEIGFFDEIFIEESESFSFTVDDPSVGIGEDNLAIKALRAVEGAVGRSLPCRIRLQKNIPAGGGLGGGSSDAAAVIRGLNRLFHLGFSIARMEEIAALFGSDTAFFVRGATSMCRGRGEIIEPIKTSAQFAFVMVFPGIHVPTGPIFQALQLTGPPVEPYDFLKELSLENGDSIRPMLFNRMEDAAMRVHPDLAVLLSLLKPKGFMMSGSGSTLFLLATSRDRAESVASDLERKHGLKTLVVTSAVRS
ncbi:MAG: 4-diphosphocytidyl-2-C-methyl-D-erythritol kinase [Planctomycetota bacterium]|jgi:4-diphosphocytidyl-2-C-methyl-D-erythritol kinase